MQTYRDFRPTAMDPAGLGLPDRQDWLVVPVSITRDTQCPVTLSNFHVAKKILREKDERVETRRFGHWGPGWFEVILVHPDLADEVESIECALADYPVLDEKDLAEREREAEEKAWQCRYTGYGRMVDTMRDVFKLSQTTVQALLNIGPDPLWELHCEHDKGTDWSSEGPSFYFGYLRLGECVTRDELAAFIRQHRVRRG